jgi:hypothetical protein
MHVVLHIVMGRAIKIDTYIYIYTYIHTHTYMHNSYIHIHTRTHTYTHTYLHTYKHTYIHTPDADHVNGKQIFPLSRNHTYTKIGQTELAKGTGLTHTQRREK